MYERIQQKRSYTVTMEYRARYTERVENFIQFRNVCRIIIVCSRRYRTKAVQPRVLQYILYLYCALDTPHHYMAADWFLLCIIRQCSSTTVIIVFSSTLRSVVALGKTLGLNMRVYLGS